MIIFTVKFEVDKTKTWTRLFNVFRESVRLHMPDIELIEKIIHAPAKAESKSASITYNTIKLGLWNDYIQQAKENVILIDCDMLCLQSAKHVFRKHFDIAFTFTGSKTGPPLNAGVVFVKPTERARQIMNTWVNINAKMYDDADYYNKYSGKYLGINQSALGAMIEAEMAEDIRKLKTREWNAVDRDWVNINEKTVFVHIKSQLRNALMTNTAPAGPLSKIMREWYFIDEQINKKPKENLPPKIKKAIYLSGAYTRKIIR